LAAIDAFGDRRRAGHAADPAIVSTVTRDERVLADPDNVPTYRG